MNEIKPAGKVDLLAQIQAAWEEFAELLSLLGKTEMTQPGVQGVWSVKDTLVHITAWEHLTAVRLKSAFSGSPLDFVPPTTSEEIDRINEQVFNENKSRPLHEVQKDFEAIHQDLAAAIDSLPDSFLQGKLNTAWGRNRPVQLLILANTIWHYTEHAEAIEKWINRKS